MPPAPTPAVHVTPTNPALGVAIRLLRRARKLTIEDLAHAADMHPTYLSGIERGRRNPTWNKLTALARVLDIPMSALAHDAEVQTQLAARMCEARRSLGLTA
jgi:transcriptional regulator with XRE-family HTH domain